MKKLLLAACAAAFALAGCGDTREARKAEAETATASAADPLPPLPPLPPEPPPGNQWSPRLADQQRQLEAALRDSGIAVARTAHDELQLTIPSDLSFDVGRSAIKPVFAPVLDRIAQALRRNPQAQARVVGHADGASAEAISEPLSRQRAAATRDYLVARGVPPAALRAEGRGAREPVADNATPEGRAQNRRVEVFIGEQGR
jgi:outer membrane protein OmpA-like peptidoglycan-associated protein